MNTWIFNPFKYIAGAKALIIGWIIMLATACLSYFSQTHFDGVIDAHYGFTTPFFRYFIDQFIAWAPMVLFIYIAGRLFSQSAIRFIDVAGTLALARWPAIFIALSDFGMPAVKDIQNMSTGIIIITLIQLILVVWMIVLMFNAFRVSCNVKGSRATILFIAALVLAELASKIIFDQAYLHI